MKKVLLICMLAFSTAISFGQNKAFDVENLKTQKKVLALNTKLNNLKLEYQKEKENFGELNEKAATVNATANVATTDFTSSDAATTVKDAKETVKTLKEAQKINKKLLTSQKKLNHLEKKMNKIQARLNEFNKKVKFVDK